MSDIELYDKSPDVYEDLQLRRPDYVKSLEILRKVAKNYLDKKGVVIADFCCGTGKNTSLLDQDIDITKAVLIDINSKFIEIAKSRNTKAQIVAMRENILTVVLNPECDAVISMFAYHHVPDGEKARYIEQVKSSLKRGGFLFLGEIYTPDKTTTSRYYDKLLVEIGSNPKRVELEKFLTETADSNNFEFKVSKTFAHKQLKEKGFELINSEKVWPADEELGIDVGMYIEVWGII